MTQKYVVSHFDQQSGPFDEQELRAKWKQGQLLPIDYVFDESKNDWVLVVERFGWAITAGTTHPPPLKRQAQQPVKPLEVSGPSVVKEWKRHAAHGARIKLVNGVGEIDLSPLKPGTIEFALQDSTASMLKMNEPLHIHVKPADPVRIEWEFSPQNTVGGDLKIQVRALDGLGYVCSDYEAPYSLKIQGSTDQDVSFKLANGIATVTLSHTKAETWKISLAGGKDVLQLPKEKSFTWEPGPAARLVLDGPQEYVAGHPLKVQVKAVDAYGNLAKTFQGTVLLEIKAS